MKLMYVQILNIIFNIISLQLEYINQAGTTTEFSFVYSDRILEQNTLNDLTIGNVSKVSTERTTKVIIK